MAKYKAQQEYLQAKAQQQQQLGRIDLKKLWEPDIELDPQRVRMLAPEYK